ncbi:hypothetical protein [Nocardia wallacei]|uniref:hypothetical protein n=1 Tax=Nocardia wallacei TaxID=480035 RepID=UPI002454986D|nr:hypothetical protein [Nocardia wallacei]
MTVLSSPPSAARSVRSGVLLVVLSVALSALGVGCSDSTESSADPDVEPTGLGKEVTVPISATVTSVVDPGAEPRSLLRPGYEIGTAQQVTLRTDHHIEQQINDQALRDFSPPALIVPLTATTSRKGVDLTLGAVTSPDPSLAQELQSADGSHAGFDINAEGAITRLRLETAPTTADAARAALERTFYQTVYRSIAFPADPVGVGAVWTVRQQVSNDVQPNEVDQVTTATLTQREGNLLTIALDITQTPQTDAWQLPGNTGSLDIVDYLMHGTGTITVDLGLPLPVSGAVAIGGHLSYREPRTEVLLRQNIRTQVRWGD